MITLTAPDGQTATVYRGTTSDGPVTLNNAAFNVNGLDGGRVNGTYTLTIDDTQTNNTGTLTGWSVTVDSDAADPAGSRPAPRWTRTPTARPTRTR